jgi:hypothetical protein
MLTRSQRSALRIIERKAEHGHFELCENFPDEDMNFAGTGFSQLGLGAYSAVLASPALPGYVVKVTTSEQDGYHDWVRFITDVGPTLPADQQAYLPRILSSEVICGVRITLMEQLAPMYDCRGNVVSEMRALKRYTMDSEPDTAAATALSKRMLRYRQSLPHAEFIRDDMHDGNFMMRDDQVVVTDPWAAKTRGRNYPE